MAPVAGRRRCSATLRSATVPRVLAATAVSTSADDPLSGLELGERPDPEAPEGWELSLIHI